MAGLGISPSAQAETTNWPTSAYAWKLLGYTNDGIYTIDPDGLGGQPPISAYCLMSVADGGWTKLTADVVNTVLNTNPNSPRHYLYVQNGTSKYYRTPESNLIWSWNTGQDLYGTYYYSTGSGESSFNITPSSEHQTYGVGGSSGGGKKPKCLVRDGIPATAQVSLCQDIPGIFGRDCVDEVTVYMRETTPLYLFITLQPQDTTVLLGSLTNLTVTAIGAEPLHYQWMFYGTNIAGATDSSLAFASAQMTDAGVYSVSVSNSYGSITSSNAVLQVLPEGAPSIQVNGVLAVGTMIFTEPVQVTISGGFPDGFIFYTLDGSEPSIESALYEEAIILTNSATVQAMSLSSDLSQTAFAPAINVRIVPLYDLQTAVVGSGSITVDPASGPYLSNSVVTLTATPADIWLFDHWAGDASGNENPLSLTMDGPRSVQAVFVPIPFYSLSTSVIGNGTLTVDPPDGPYLSNSVVTVTANGTVDWPFDHWTGDASGNENPLSVTMDGPRSVQAVFIQNYPLTVSTPGGGEVTVNGQAIAPGTFYPVGSTQTLEAIASSGWSFLGWQGDASGTNNPLLLTMNQTNHIQAIFGTVVGTNPVGAGSIILNQPNPVPYGTRLTASAAPDAGKYFVSWGGAASGTSAPTTITVTNPTPTISALFSTLPSGKYSLGVVVMGKGAVAINPQRNYYSPEEIVALDATPVPGVSSFYGWTRDASGTNSSITVAMNASKIVQANFGGLPVVSISPLNQIVVVGGEAVLTASAVGIPPLAYQWQNSQGAIAGATNATFTILDAQAADADDYSVVVSNPFGSVTSAVATVTVVFPPSISSQPQGNTVAAGTMVTLDVVADGTPPLNYQWFNSGGAIPGATNASYVLNPAQTSHWDNYYVTVSNAYGEVASSAATLIVYAPVDVTGQPISRVVPNGGPVSFEVIASGFPAPTSYQWTLNGADLPGATSSSFSLNSVRLADLGDYQVLISNGYSSTNSSIATLHMSPSITSPFIGATVIWGQSATLSVGAIGSGDLVYQWYKDGEAIEGATDAALNFASIQFTNAGLYSVVVSSLFGSTTNVAAQVVINPAGVSLSFSPTLTIEGVIGYSYIIDRTADLADTNAWVTLTNLTLTQPVEIWVDTSADASSPFHPRYFYRVLPGQ